MRGSDDGRAAGRAEAETLRDLLVRNALALNLIRLTLALLVFADHAYVLGGYGDGITWPTGGRLTTFGSFAVGAFFALSGLLVTMSGLRRTPFEFLRSRFLRIVPAYATVVILSALVLAPLVWRDVHGSMTGFWTTQPGGPLGYVVHNLRFPLDLQYGINDVFLTTTPYGQEFGISVINGSLWTLPVEVRCYLVALFVVVIGRGLGVTRTALVALAFVCALLALDRTAPEIAAQVTPPWLANTLWEELTAAFLVGAVIGTRAHVLRVTRPVIGVAALVYVLASLQGGTTFRTFGLGSLAILLPVLASRLPAGRLNVFRHDLSYGTYLWAFPVQQTLAHVGLIDTPVLYVALGLVLTLALASLSWVCIERPALRRRRTRRLPDLPESTAEPRVTPEPAGAPAG